MFSFISLLSVRQNIFIALQRFCEIMGLLWQWQVQIHCQKVQLFSIHFHKQELCSFILNFSAKLKLLGILNRKPSCFTSFISFYTLIISFHFTILLSTQYIAMMTSSYKTLLVRVAYTCLTLLSFLNLLIFSPK